MHNKDLYVKLSIWICIILGIFLVAFSGYKAYFDSFTHDESKTWFDSIHRSIREIITYNYPEATTNNQLLNTLLMKGCSVIFGDSEFSLRFPNWLAHILYVFFCIRSLLLFKNPMLIISGFVFLNFNPYLVDFFSIARGYGLALAFMMGSMYYFLKYIKDQNWTNNIMSNIFCFLAIVANLTWINYFIALIAMINYYNLLTYLTIPNKKRGFYKVFIKSNIPAFLSAIIIYLIFNGPIKILNSKNEFFFGGKFGFWADTAFRLIKDSLYSQASENLAGIALAIAIIILTLSAIYLVSDIIFIKFNTASSPVFGFMLMLFITGFSTYLQHILFGTLFLMDRTSLLFIPLVMMYLICLFDYLLTIKKSVWLFKILLSGFAILLFTHFILVAKLVTVYEYAYDGKTKNMLLALDKDVPQNLRKPEGIYVWAPWVCVPTINFYRVTKNMEWVRKLDLYQNADLSTSDYAYIIKINNEDRLQYKKEHKRIVAEFPETRTALVKWK